MPDRIVRVALFVSALLLPSTAVVQAQEPISGPDILVNDPALDLPTAGRRQMETTVAVAGSMVCVAWMDTGEVEGATRIGFGSSTDAGKSFTDHGAIPDIARADPAMAYSRKDDAFYLVALRSPGITMYKSTDGCQTFASVGPLPDSGGEDKEFIAIDNNPGSNFYGRIYVAWTNVNELPKNRVTYSSNGGASWAPVQTFQSGIVAGDRALYPAIAPNGNVFWSFTDFLTAPQDHLLFRSENGGGSWEQMPNIVNNVENPGSLGSCNWTFLNGPHRVTGSPQLAIQPSAQSPAGYIIHAAYTVGGVDPDMADVIYRRSADGGQTWTEQKLNDDATTTDQWHPAIAANDLGHVVVSWYDRRLDPVNNKNYDRYMAISDDTGLTWRANRRVTDLTPTYVGGCNHGDYDRIAVDKSKAYVVWADDRRGDIDIYFNQVPLIPQGALEPSTRLLLLP